MCANSSLQEPALNFSIVYGDKGIDKLWVGAYEQSATTVPNSPLPIQSDLSRLTPITVVDD